MDEDRVGGIGRQAAGSIGQAALSGNIPADRPQPAGLDAMAAAGEVQVLALHAEQASVSKRIRKTRVHVARTTRTREETIEEDLARDQVVVERVAIGRVVDAAPEIRQEGDVTIISVVEEVVVVERRLILKEEVHLRRVRTTQRHVETVTLREQDVAITRTDLES